jgi:hypothetical protein
MSSGKVLARTVGVGAIACATAISSTPFGGDIARIGFPPRGVGAALFDNPADQTIFADLHQPVEGEVASIIRIADHGDAGGDVGAAIERMVAWNGDLGQIHIVDHDLLARGFAYLGR